MLSSFFAVLSNALTLYGPVMTTQTQMLPVGAPSTPDALDSADHPGPTSKNKRRGDSPCKGSGKRSRSSCEGAGRGADAHGDKKGPQQASESTSSDTHHSSQQRQTEQAANGASNSLHQTQLHTPKAQPISNSAEPHVVDHPAMHHKTSHHEGEGANVELQDQVFSPPFHLPHEHTPASSPASSLKEAVREKEGAEELSSEDEFDENAENREVPLSQAGAASGSLMTLPHHYRMGAAAAQQQTIPSNGAAAAPEPEEEEDDFLDFDPLLFIKQLPSLEACVPKFRPTILPKKTRACKQKTLVLDLDETLVHSSLEAVEKCDFSFPVCFNNMEHTVYVRQRPHLHEFMERVAEIYEVVVFTASQKIYAERLLNILDPQHRLIKHRIYRDSCVMVDGNYLKDLTILGRDLSQMAIVDNSPQAFGFQVDNGIPIESWYEDESDRELANLLPFLEKLVLAEDVRPLIREQFRLQELIDQA